MPKFIKDIDNFSKNKFQGHKSTFMKCPTE